MSDLGAFQATMAAALLAGDGDACPAALRGADRRRFRVYRNNVHHGLAEALAAAYPAVRRLVGEAFFRAMARVFLSAHPPRSRSLALMGGELADFLDDFAPAASLPYLADVARLERAVLEATHAADAEPLDPAAIAAGETHIAVHPAARVVASRHPIVSIWQAQQTLAGPATIRGEAETALVTRPRHRVLVHRLARGEGAFAAAIVAGADGEAAAMAARTGDVDFDPIAGWRPLLANGALTASPPAAEI